MRDFRRRVAELYPLVIRLNAFMFVYLAGYTLLGGADWSVHFGVIALGASLITGIVLSK